MHVEKVHGGRMWVMNAYISGVAVNVVGPLVSAHELRPILMEAIGVTDIIRGAGTGGPRFGGPIDYQYLPRQNKPNGITGDGNYLFDLRECNDFIMTPVAAGYDADFAYDRLKGLNLYGQEVGAMG